MEKLIEKQLKINREESSHGEYVDVNEKCENAKKKGTNKITNSGDKHKW